MLYRARSIPAALIDATPVMMAVHQNHDYSHHPQGKDSVWNGDEALTNHDLLAAGCTRLRLTMRRICLHRKDCG